MRRRMKGLGGFAAGDGDLRGHGFSKGVKTKPQNATEARKKIRPIDMGAAAKMIARMNSDEDDRTDEGLRALITERDLARAIKNNTLIEQKARAAAAKAVKSGKKRSTALDLELASQLGLDDIGADFGAGDDDIFGGILSNGGGGADEGDDEEDGGDPFGDEFTFGDLGEDSKTKSKKKKRKTRSKGKKEKRVNEDPLAAFDDFDFEDFGLDYEDTGKRIGGGGGEPRAVGGGKRSSSSKKAAAARGANKVPKSEVAKQRGVGGRSIGGARSSGAAGAAADRGAAGTGLGSVARQRGKHGSVRDGTKERQSKQSRTVPRAGRGGRKNTVKAKNKKEKKAPMTDDIRKLRAMKQAKIARARAGLEEEKKRGEYVMCLTAAM